MGQSFVLSEIKTEVLLDCLDPAYQNFQLQQYGERIERLSQQHRFSKFCMDAGFLNVVEIGQYFMTKDTGDLTQFNTVACREYTIPREDSTSQPKGWIQGNTQIGLVLEVTTSCLHGKHGVEIRIWSLSRDNTHSWVRISHGSNKFVMDLENNDTEIPEDQLEEQALQLDAKDFVYRSKAKAKPQRRELAGSSPRIVPIERRNWIDIEPALFEYEVSKKVIYLLRHSQKVHREEDGAVHFWRRGKSPESIPTVYSLVWRSMEISVLHWYFRNNSFFSELFNDIQDAILQDNVIIQSGFFQHIYHIGCAVNLHSIIHSGLILGGQNSSTRHTVFFLPIDPLDKSH